MRIRKTVASSRVCHHIIPETSSRGVPINITHSSNALSLWAEGGANKIYVDRSNAYRLSKANVEPAVTKAVWDRWRQYFGIHMDPMEIVHLDALGTVLQMPFYGNRALGKRIILEFKPKWLWPSPDAPPDANACRTCAMMQIKAKHGFCPIELRCAVQSSDYTRIATLLQQCESISDLDALRCAELALPILKLLAETQKGMPSIFGSEPSLPEIEDAMSIRDCSILIEGGEQGTDWRGVIIDLDVKDASRKLEHWRSLELALIPLYERGVEGCFLSKRQ